MFILLYLIISFAPQGDYDIWRYKAGDDPEWSQPLLDDRDWEQGVFPSLEQGAYPKTGWQGIGWFRFRFRAEEPIRNRLFALVYGQIGASEIYLDGKLLFKFGKVSINPDQEQTLRTFENPGIYPIWLDDKPHHDIAIRYSNHDFERTILERTPAGFSLFIKEWETGLSWKIDQTRFWTWNQMIFTVASLTIGILHLLLFFYYPSVRTNLYFSLFTVSISLATFLPPEMRFLTETKSYLILLVMAKLAFLLVGVTGMKLLHTLFNPRSKIFYRILLLAALPFTLALGWIPASGFMAFALLAVAEMVRVLFIAFLNRDEGSGLLSLGFLGFLVPSMVQFMDHLSIFNLPDSFDYVFGWGVLILLLTMSANLAREFAKGHRSKEARGLAEQANSAKSRFLAHMSHELRTPLNGILGFTQILEKEPGLNEVQKRGLNTIHRCGTHLLTLINDILDLSKVEAHQMELETSEFELKEFLSHLNDIALVKAQAKGLIFEFKSADNLPKFICADEKRLRQILFNLLGNAIKFTEAGSVSMEIQYETGPDMQTLVFQITDTGPGIGQPNLSEIFQPFTRIKGNIEEGAGLGLAISQELTHLMKGSLDLQSERGKGSTFRLKLPIEKGDGEKPKTVQPILKQPIGYLGPARKVLVVDDTIENLDVFERLMTPLGFEVLSSGSGYDCIRQADQLRPDLIIIDLLMPGLDGFEVFTQLRQNPSLASIKLVASSANVSEETIKESLEAGFDDFISKPVVEPLFWNTLERVLQLKWRYNLTKLHVRPEVHEIPSNHYLEAILAFARTGNILELREKVATLEQSNQYAVVVKELGELLDEFKMKAMCDYVESLLKRRRVVD